MAVERKNVFSLDNILFAQGSPVLITGGSMGRDRRHKKCRILISVKNISPKPISALRIVLRPLDDKGQAAWGDTACQLEELELPRDGELGQDRPFELTDDGAASFTASVERVVFADGSIWDGSSAQWSAFPPQKTLSEALGGEELAAQYRIRYGTDCVKMPDSAQGLWFCACGGVNHDSETACHICRRSFAALKNVNLSSLKLDCAARLKNEQERSQEAQEESQVKKKKHGRLTLFIAPVALLLALIIAVLPGFIEDKKAYNSAAAMLSAGMYDDARAAFEQLGAYGDSREQAEKNVPYQRALYVLDCADKALTPGLTQLNLRRSEFEDDEHMRLALYQGAAELFDGLDGYRDSAARSEYALTAAAQVQEELNKSAYDAAAALLADGYFCQARDGFEALGDYKDSQEKARECIYQKAAGLLDFVEKYNVRGVSAKLSIQTDSPSLIHITGAALARMGSGSTIVLHELCDKDGVELDVDGEAAGDLSPICQCVERLLLSLGDYKDSPALAQRAVEAGDFTKPFFSFCQEGKLAAAASWLAAYDGEFEDREGWMERLNVYLPYCQNWGLYLGDSTLIPLTVGAEGACGSFESRVALSGGTATLLLIFGETGENRVELSAEPNEVKFTSTDGNGAYYFAALNNSKRFTYVKYDDQGVIVSSCEYQKE